MPAFASPTHATDDRALADRADEFGALASEVRLEILLALAPADGRERPVRSFSALQHRTSVRDGGRFNYHLERLQPQFVTATDDGYRLTEAGAAVVAVIGRRATGPGPDHE